jgi:hypothetical protein
LVGWKLWILMRFTPRCRSEIGDYRGRSGVIFTLVVSEFCDYCYLTTHISSVSLVTWANFKVRSVSSADHLRALRRRVEHSPDSCCSHSRSPPIQLSAYRVYSPSFLTPPFKWTVFAVRAS